jgi:single-strand DNA-binding protein
MINVGTLLGRVGKKDSKTTKNGVNVTVLSIATSKKYKDSQGTAQEITTWHNVNCFSKLADVATKYVHVGDLIYVTGEIQNKKIESGERAGQYMYSIHANDIKFIPKVKAHSGNKKPEKEEAKESENFEDDDIPF